MALTFLTTGCWDRVEINNRGFVVGVSVDAQPAKEDEDKSTARSFRICYQIVIPGAQKGGTEGGKASSGYSNLCGEAVSLSAFNQFAADKLSRPPFYDHLKVIIISDRVARVGSGFSDSLDFFLRGTGLRRSIKILVAKGDASQALNSESPNEKLPATDIENISGNRRSLEKPPASHIGYIHERLMNETSFAVQQLETQNKSILVSGSAVFDGRTNREAGTLDARQTAGRNFLLGSKMRGFITFQSDGIRVALDVYEIRSHMRANVRDPEHIVFDVSVHARVSIRETTGAQDLMNTSVMNRIQSDAADEIESMIADAVDKIQHDIRKDALGLGDYLKKNHYHTWKKISNDWDRGKYMLGGCIVKPQVKVSVLQMGIVDKSERG